MNAIFNSDLNIYNKTIFDMTYISNIWNEEICHTSLDVSTLFHDVNMGLFGHNSSKTPSLRHGPHSNARCNFHLLKKLDVLYPGIYR